MQTTSRTEIKYADLIQFMHKATAGTSDQAIERIVLTVFDSQVKASEQLIISNAKAAKVPTFAGLDFRKKETFNELVGYIEGHFREFYLPQVKALIKALPAAKSKNAIFQKVISIMESKSPLECLMEIIAIEARGPEPGPEPEPTQDRPSGRSVRQFLGGASRLATGLGLTVGVAARQKTLLGAAGVVGLSAYRSVGGFGGIGRAIGSSLGGIFGRRPSTVAGDFTPREEKIETDRKQSAVVGLLEAIELNTRGMGGGAGGKNGRGKGNLGALAAFALGDLFEAGKMGLLGLVTTILGLIPPALVAMGITGGVTALVKWLFGGGSGGGALDKLTPHLSNLSNSLPDFGKRSSISERKRMNVAATSTDVFSAAAFSETSSNDYTAIARDVNNELSYGRLQLNSPAQKAKFFNLPGIKEHFEGLQMDSPEFQAKFKEVMSTNQKARDIYDNFFEESFYKPTEALAKKHGLNVTDPGMQKLIASTGVQFSPQGQEKIFSTAGTAISNKKDATVEDQMDALTSARILQYGKGMKRYLNEREIAKTASRLSGLGAGTMAGKLPGSAAEEYRNIIDMYQKKADEAKTPEEKKAMQGVVDYYSSMLANEVVPAKPSKPNVVPETKGTGAGGVTTNIVAPTTNTNVQNVQSKDVPDSRNRMNPAREMQMNRLVAP